MGYQATFKRYEMKYMLTPWQKKTILKAMEPYMALDAYGRTTIRNIYFDTDNYRLIRRSLEKPSYKEKLRIRSYQPANGKDPVFIELKKKYDKVVYKRRLTIEDRIAQDCFTYGKSLPVDSQIAREIEYFRGFYGDLTPAVFLTYEREAFYDRNGGDFRVTFDENILYRDHDFALGSEIYGTPILKEGQTLMEIKTSGGIPLWMTQVMSEQNIFITSFSKYGTAYRQMMTDQMGQRVSGTTDSILRRPAIQGKKRRIQYA